MPAGRPLSSTKLRPMPSHVDDHAIKRTPEECVRAENRPLVRRAASKFLQCGRITTLYGHRSSPNFLPKRFSDKILLLTLAVVLLSTTKLSVGRGGTWPRMASPRRAFSDEKRYCNGSIYSKTHLLKICFMNV